MQMVSQTLTDGRHC